MDAQSEELGGTRSGCFCLPAPAAGVPAACCATEAASVQLLKEGGKIKE